MLQCLQPSRLFLYSLSYPLAILGVFYVAAPHADLCPVVWWIRSMRCEAAVLKVGVLPEVQGQAHISPSDTNNVSCSSASCQFSDWFCCTLFEGLTVILNTSAGLASGRVIGVCPCWLCVNPPGYNDSGTIPSFLCFSFSFWASLLQLMVTLRGVQKDYKENGLYSGQICIPVQRTS